MSASLLSGVVVGDYGRHCDVRIADGTLLRCTARRRIGEVVCGDNVNVEPTIAGEAVVVEWLPRRSLLQRPDPRGRLKSVAANVDRMIVVLPPRIDGTPDDVLDLFALDRYLAAAECAHVTPIIVINKTDLVAPAVEPAVEQMLAVYRQLGYALIRTSCRNGSGIDELRHELADHIGVLVGPSGAGKSSLVAALLPGIDTRIGEVSASTGHGKHTTTWTQMYALPSGGQLIDSPGVREFGLWLTAAREVAEGFREFAALKQHCRFLDCAHVSEPGCAVKAAVESGALAPWRYAHFRRLITAT